MTAYLVPNTNKIPEYFNYTHTKKNYPLVKLLHLEKIAFSGFLAPVNSNSQRELKLKVKICDLPLISDFGDDINPVNLIYARLEGLQYASHR